jgi:hypothetical protein
MKRNLMVILSFAVILAFIVPVTTNAQSGKANFAGTWAFNESKSDMGQGGGGGRGFGGGDMVVKQDGNTMSVDRTRTNRDGESVTTTEKYSLDGKETVNSTGRGDSKSVAKWSADGKSLSVTTSRTFDMNGETREMKSTAVWTLTDAKTLAVTTTMNTQNGEMTRKMVYDKK